MYSTLVKFGLLGLALVFREILGQRTRQHIPINFPRTPEMIQSHGYPVESHVVQTSDGYLLTMHRIPYGKSSKGRSQRDKPVVYLQHGLVSSSADWVVIGPKKGLGYLLADEGYDVWMGNSRGNTYSRNHTTLNPNNYKFWNFSFHEIGIHDLPVSIDYILSETGRKGLSYIGHSQGSTVLFILLSMVPQYNDLIVSTHVLGPTVFMSHLKNPTIRFIGNFLDKLGLLNGFWGNSEILPSIYIVQLLGFLCANNSPFQGFCIRMYNIIFDENLMQLDKTLIPSFVVNAPAGSSLNQVVHFLQLYKSGHFRQFDYGAVKNFNQYGSYVPPDYPLERITTPISLHYSEKDWLVAIEDINILRSKLSNLIGAFRVPSPFNHADYLWGIDVKELVYDNLIRLINGFNKK